MYYQPIKAFDNVKNVFTEVMEMNHELLGLSISEVIKHIKENQVVLVNIEENYENINVADSFSILLKKRCSELACKNNSPSPNIVRAQAYIEEQYICSNIFSVLQNHFIYLEELEHNIHHEYKNVINVLLYHLGGAYCYKNDKKILTELFQCALYIFLLNRKKYVIEKTTIREGVEHSLHKEIADRCVALQSLIENCTHVEYEIEQDHIILTEESLASIQYEIEKDITIIGGKRFLEYIYKRVLCPCYDIRLDLYCIHRNKAVAGLTYHETPINFLILLALKILKNDNPDTQEDVWAESRYKRIIKMSQNFLLVLQLTSPSVLEETFVTPANLNAYICNNMMFDKMVIPVQYNVTFLLDVLKIFFYSFDEQFVGKKYSIRTYSRVVRKILESGKQTFDYKYLKKLTRVSKEELDSILYDISIDADKANADFTSILEPTNSKDFPLIKLADNTYYFFDARISGVGFYRALYRQLNQMTSTITNLNNKLGKILEKYIKDLLKMQHVTYVSGNYSIKKGDGGECDVIIQNVDTICGLELKYTLLNKDFEIGDDVSLYSTLGKGMIKAQRQLLKHRMDLIQQKSLTLTDENKKSNVLTYNGEKIISISVCFSEYRFLTTKIITKNILNSIYYGKVGLRDVSRAEELESFYIEQEKIKKLLDKARVEKLFGDKQFRPFMNSLFLSLQQIYLACKLCKNVNDFIEFINNQLFVITGSLDYYAELIGFMNSKESRH